MQQPRIWRKSLLTHALRFGTVEVCARVHMCKLFISVLGHKYESASYILIWCPLCPPPRPHQRTSFPAKLVGSGSGARGTSRPIWCTTAAGGSASRRPSWRRATPVPTRPPASALFHSVTRASPERGPWKCTSALHTLVSRNLQVHRPKHSS